MRAAVTDRWAAIAIGHADQIVRRAFIMAQRFDGAVDNINAVLGRGFCDAWCRVEGCGHAPWAGVGFRKAHKICAFRFGAGDEVDRIGDIFLRLLNRIGDRLHNGDAECHALLQTGIPVSVRA